MPSVLTIAAALALLVPGAPTALAAPQDGKPAPAPSGAKPAKVSTGAESQDAPKPDAAQDSGQKSQALEDLLRRLQAERKSAGIIPPNPDAPEAPHVAAGPAPSRTIRLTRTSDLVQVVHGGQLSELAFWDKSLELLPGDEVRQGPKAVALYDFPDGANYRFDGPAIVHITSDALASPRRFEVERLSRFAYFALGRGEVVTVLTLPGGNELAGRNARLSVRDFDLRALEIRNSGPEPVVVRSPYLGPTIVSLAAGQRIYLPVLPEPSAFVTHLTHDVVTGDDPRGRLVVQAEPEIGLKVNGAAVELHGDGPVTAVARACGARFVLRPGEQLKLARAPLGAPRRKEWDE